MANPPAKCKKDDDKDVNTPPAKSKKGGSKVVQQHAEANSANNAQASTNDTYPPAAGASSNTNANKTKASGTNGTDGTINEQTDAHDATAKKTTNGTMDAMVGKDNASANMGVDEANTQNVNDTPHANKDAPSQNVISYSVTFSLMHTIVHVICC
jgi:hypothetical protein